MRRGEKTREAILTAPEAVFAEHGFDGARIDRIAEVSGFNKTLIFRYFGHKLGLYPTSSLKNTIAIIAGTIIVALVALYIGWKWKSFK